MVKIKDLLIDGAGGRRMAVDVFCADAVGCPLLVYMHGFNGFKDWGAFDLIAEQFAAAGFCFVKFNASHNGTTPQQPETFADPEAYGNNNYSKELFDLQAVLNFALSAACPVQERLQPQRVFLLGHSRGGGIALLQAAADERVGAVATWASVTACTTPWGNWPPERLAQWRQTGVDHYRNSRTGQQLPLYYQLYEDYEANREKLDVLAAVGRLHKPLLICHGTLDEAVPVAAAYKLFAAAPQASLFLLPSDHVFGRKHPWTSPTLPSPMQQVVDVSISFFRGL